jgi:outer membrane protein assembly factor BamD (BamD/ComL family)
MHTTMEPASFEGLFNRLPFTPASLQVSNDSIRSSLQTLGVLYVNEMEDYPSAIKTYEELRRRFPLEELSPDALFQLHYSHAKSGDAVKAEEAKKLLLQKYPQDRRSVILSTGKDPLSSKPSEAVTKTYERIYDLFLEGKFAEALDGKKVADSLYRTNYWSPQLLYIEAVYHIRQRDDSAARMSLLTLVRQNAGSPMAAKAQTMLDVLSRREQIESELTRLQIQRPAEDTLYVEPMPVAKSVQKQASVVAAPTDTAARKVTAAKPLTDTAFKKPAPVKNNALFTFKTDAPYYAVVVLDKVDPVFVNEARNAFNRYNKEKFYNVPLEVTGVPVNDDIKLLVVGMFTNAQGAVDYVQRTGPVTAAQIVPWLKADKFSFSIITKENLDVVTGLKDFTAYKKFLEQNLPIKF